MERQRSKSAPTTAEGLRSFLQTKEGSALRAWLKHFDRDNDGRTRKHDFYRGLAALGFNGDVASLFSTLDRDHSGELALEEVDSEQARLWQRFCDWCEAGFSSAAELVRALGGEEQLGQQQFARGLAAAGWSERHEALLFSALDVEGTGSVGVQNLHWLDEQQRRLQRQAEAKERSRVSGARRLCRRREARVLVHEFRCFLLQKFGDYLRAWRLALSPRGGLSVCKPQFFKACAKLGWQSASRLLWEGLDRDGSGAVSLEEVDMRSMELLARFRALVGRCGGAAAAFRALDRANTRQLQLRDFAEALENLGGSQQDARQLFKGLSHGKALTEEDLLFLDDWRPQPYLLAAPNAEAAAAVKALLLQRFSSQLKAWRQVLDREGTNYCSWGEFQAGCMMIAFTGDAPGAWRALDADLSGYITLRELDAEAQGALLHFKHWADEGFGSTRAAFGVFDTDGSRQLSRQEFCRACRAFRYTGDAHGLFAVLDADHQGALGLEDIAFLDDWESEEPVAAQEEPRRQQRPPAQPPLQPKRRPARARQEAPAEELPPSMRLLQRQRPRPQRQQEAVGRWLAQHCLPPLHDGVSEEEPRVQASVAERALAVYSVPGQERRPLLKASGPPLFATLWASFTTRPP